MSTNTLSVLLLVLGCLMATPAPAQDQRELSDEVGTYSMRNVLDGSINQYTSAGYRVVDLEYVGTDGFGRAIWDAEFVRNTGPYQTGYWYYYDLTASQLASTLSANQARLIDLEPYQSGAGLKFACIMVPNTGRTGVAWWYYFNTTTSNIGTQAANNNARIVDLESYTLNGQTFYAAVMVRNTGSFARSWWWYVNITPFQMNLFLNSNGARLYDLERRSNGNFDCVMIRHSPTPHWYYWYDLTANQLANRVENYGARITDVEGYASGSTRRYAAVAVNNSNDLETEVGNAMRAATDGTVGFSLHEIGRSSPVQWAAHNYRRLFEPASTMKTLHHLHAMYQAHVGAVNLQSPLVVYQAYSPTNSSCPIDVNPTIEPLDTVLTEMMQASDNARTQAVTARFGETQINNTGILAGMTDTHLNHRLGCGVEAIINPNWTTLRDLTTLHDWVADNRLGSDRDTFYELMLTGTGDLGLQSVALAEGAALGMTNGSISNFLSRVTFAHKGGSYDLQSGSNPFFYHRAEFAFLALPWYVNGAIVEREFAYGAFVNNASSGAAADDAIWNEGLPRLIRPVVRAALESWVGHTALTTTVGTGCGSPGYTHTTHAPPRMGLDVGYRAHNGLPNALAAFAIGLSDTAGGGFSFPLALQPFGFAPGCTAFNDLALTWGYATNGSGFSTHTVSIPSDASVLDVEFFSQWYSFDVGVPALSSNGLRTRIGL